MFFRQNGLFARDYLNRRYRDEADTHLKSVFGSVVGRVHDRSTTLNTSSRGRRGQRKLIVLWFSFELDGTVFLVGVSSSMGVFVSVQSVFRNAAQQEHRPLVEHRHHIVC